MLDGYVAAIVAGPVSISPLDWICPLLAVDADAFTMAATPSRPLQVGSSRSTDASPMATSMRALGAAAFTLLRPLCGCGYRTGCHYLITATSTTASCYRFFCTVATIKGVRGSGRCGGDERAGILPTPISRRLSRPHVGTRTGYFEGDLMALKD